MYPLSSWPIASSGRLTPDGIVDEADGAVTVRAKSTNGPTGMFKFAFGAEGKVEGIAIELSN